MADFDSTCLANPNLNLTPEEKRVFGQLFQAADTESVGVVTGEVAVKFFEKTRLEPRVLGEVGTASRQSSWLPESLTGAVVGRSGISQTQRIEAFLRPPASV